MKKRNNTLGFTLLEILIALFIFTILSLMMARALHTVIQAQTETERRAESLRNLQMALLIFSRDISQIVNRPVVAANGTDLVAFEGSARAFTFTHAGYAVAGTMLTHSNLQRAGYLINQQGFWRQTWAALDQAGGSMPSLRLLLPNISSGSFQYLAKDGKFYAKWPLTDGVTQNQQALPKAVKVELTISGWGSITQIYVIPVQTDTPQAQTVTPPAPGGNPYNFPAGFPPQSTLPTRP